MIVFQVGLYLVRFYYFGMYKLYVLRNFFVIYSFSLCIVYI